MNFKYRIVLLVLFSIILSGCQGIQTKPRVEKISEEKSTLYIDEYFQEYSEIKNAYIDNSLTKWVQALNKKEPCKVFVGTSTLDDRTLHDDFKIYWDGECKNGYADGLGREFMYDTFIDIRSIAIYSNAPNKEPEYFTQREVLDNEYAEGDINNRYLVASRIEQSPNFYFMHEYGYFGKYPSPSLTVSSSPLDDQRNLKKEYPNFMYELIDSRNDEFSNYAFTVGTKNRRGKYHGYGMLWYKNSQSAHVEMANNFAISRVQLPESYFDKMQAIEKEINNAARKALSAQQKAIKVKNKYKKLICNESVTVEFMNNSEYKEICKEEQIYADLQEKITARRNEIYQEKMHKVAQMREEQIKQQRIAQQTQQQNDDNVSILHALGTAMQSLADGVNSNRSTYTAPAFKTPDMSSWNTFSPDNTNTYRSTIGNTYKYDLSKPTDSLMYSVDPNAQLMDSLNPSVERDRSLGQQGGGIQ